MTWTSGSLLPPLLLSSTAGDRPESFPRILHVSLQKAEQTLAGVGGMVHGPAIPTRDGDWNVEASQRQRSKPGGKQDHIAAQWFEHRFDTYSLSNVKKHLFI